MREIEIGLAESYSVLPALVTIEGRRYYLTRHDGRLHALSTICPHKGGDVEEREGVFECPQHGWKYDQQSGRCLNVANVQLATHPVIEREGRLFLQVSQAAAETARPRVLRRGRFTLKMHAHACFEIDFRGFRLLTDPWLDGPAFMGAWVQYPPPAVKPADLKPDAILITHEHSDHFHEPTLAQFSRQTPIYAPDFPNRRILERLAALGFTNVVPLPFGEVRDLAPDLRVTAFEPAGVWNDAIFVIDVAGFRVLNLNDAGINRNIPEKVGPVDLIAAQFSIGASGYPWTWDHVPREEKVAIMSRARLGRLQMLEQAVELYQGRYLLPFASHFALWHPSHREFMELMPRVSFEDVRRQLAGKAEVLDLLPGSQWDARTLEITHAIDEREWLEGARAVAYAAGAYDEAAFRRDYAHVPPLSREALAQHLLRLNHTPEIAFCEDLRVLIELVDEGAVEPAQWLAFEIAQSRLRILDDCDNANLTMRLPERALARIVHENASWDELHIGYWGSYRRTPDVYTPGFWRLIQAPYYKRPLAATASGGNRGAIAADSVVAGLVESYGDQASRIMRRYGLYCAGCHRSTYETLETAAQQHGLEATRTSELLRELREACG